MEFSTEELLLIDTAIREYHDQLDLLKGKPESNNLKEAFDKEIKTIVTISRKLEHYFDEL